MLCSCLIEIEMGYICDRASPLEVDNVAEEYLYREGSS